MIKKLFRYILSKRRDRKIAQLRTLHKMQSLSHIERALRVCKQSIELFTEPSLKQRINTLMSVKSPSYIEVAKNLDEILNAAKITSGSKKYIEPKDWFIVPERLEYVDDWFITDRDYIGVKPALMVFIELLELLQKELAEPHNTNFVDYYNSRAHHLYTEISNIAVGVSENV